MRSEVYPHGQRGVFKKQRERAREAVARECFAVKATLRRVGVAAAEVDDLVQNVFVVAQRRVTKLPKDAEGARGWLLDTARKHAANWHRLCRHQYEVLGCDEIVNETAAEPKDPEAQLALRDLVWRALDKLDDDERRALIGHHLGGQTMSELGKVLGLSRAGAYVRVRKAEKRFRELVGRYARWSDPAHDGHYGT
jgi:RNA polymerase sigma factor (sigma-70 family)